MYDTLSINIINPQPWVFNIRVSSGVVQNTWLPIPTRPYKTANESLGAAPKHEGARLRRSRSHMQPGAKRLVCSIVRGAKRRSKGSYHNHSLPFIRIISCFDHVWYRLLSNLVKLTQLLLFLIGLNIYKYNIYVYLVAYHTDSIHYITIYISRLSGYIKLLQDCVSVFYGL